jgi:hypothetical protein
MYMAVHADILHGCCFSRSFIDKVKFENVKWAAWLNNLFAVDCMQISFSCMNAEINHSVHVFDLSTSAHILCKYIKCSFLVT